MMNCMNVQEETYMVVFATSIRSTLPVYPCFLTWIFDKTLYPHSLDPQSSVSTFLVFLLGGAHPMSLDLLPCQDDVTPICQQLVKKTVIPIDWKSHWGQALFYCVLLPLCIHIVSNIVPGTQQAIYVCVCIYIYIYTYIHYIIHQMIQINISYVNKELDHKKWLNTKELILSNYSAGEDSWESFGLQGDQTSQS